MSRKEAKLKEALHKSEKIVQFDHSNKFVMEESHVYIVQSQRTRDRWTQQVFSGVILVGSFCFNESKWTFSFWDDGQFVIHLKLFMFLIPALQVCKPINKDQK